MLLNQFQTMTLDEAKCIHVSVRGATFSNHHHQRGYIFHHIAPAGEPDSTAGSVTTRALMKLGNNSLQLLAPMLGEGPGRPMPGRWAFTSRPFDISPSRFPRRMLLAGIHALLRS